MAEPYTHRESVIPASLRGRWLADEPLARHSSWRCGGPAAQYFEPADRADLACFLAALPSDVPVYWLGLGSNVLVRDGGIAGAVVSTSAGLDRYRWLDDEHLEAECGVPCARLARLAAAHDRTGLEFLAGIPGTLGGALRMNAGALGSETWEYVASVETIDRRGTLRRREHAEFVAHYRSIEMPEPAWFLSAVLHLPHTAGGGTERIRGVLAQRSATQPTGQATCGSVFKNPPGDYAGRLIEQCGLKGYRLGGAYISTVHANFIVNDRQASAADIEALIAHVRHRVETATGVCLETEVECVGNAVRGADV